MKQLPLFLSLFAFFMIVLVAPTFAQENTSSKDQTVQVTLKEWQIAIDKQVLTPGKITFKAINQGTVTHEMVVIKTDLPAETFEVAGGKVKEDAVGTVMGEIEGLPPKKEQTLTLDLSEGVYVLFCNNLEKGKTKGHYQKGMRISFSVARAH